MKEAYVAAEYQGERASLCVLRLLETLDHILIRVVAISRSQRPQDAPADYFRGLYITQAESKCILEGHAGIRRRMRRAV